MSCLHTVQGSHAFHSCLSSGYTWRLLGVSTGQQRTPDSFSDNYSPMVSTYASAFELSRPVYYGSSCLKNNAPLFFSGVTLLELNVHSTALLVWQMYFMSRFSQHANL